LVGGISNHLTRIILPMLLLLLLLLLLLPLPLLLLLKAAN
jgi:hypothetical protein